MFAAPNSSSIMGSVPARHRGVASGMRSTYQNSGTALPPVSSLFAAVLGVNPVQHLLAAGGVLASLPPASQRTLTGREFFPELISGPFHHGLTIVFAVATVLAVVAAIASLLRGGRHTGLAAADEPAKPAAEPLHPTRVRPGQ
jgi:hypothetical protein